MFSHLPGLNAFALSAGLLLVPVAGSAGLAADPPTNKYCPVMPTELALPEHRAVFQGRTVTFCCEECVQKFNSRPEAYASQLTSPAPQGSSERNLTDDQHWGFRLVLDAADHVERHWAVYAAVLTMLAVMGFAAWGRQRLARGGREPGRASRLLGLYARPTSVVILLLLSACVVLYRDRDRMPAPNEAGPPPEMEVPSAAIAQLNGTEKYLEWAWPQALHALPKGLKATYYRGNDERSPKLFNGGIYRTATFHVAVRAVDGEDLQPGQKWGNQEFRLRVEIIRAPKTAPNFFRADHMARVFLYPLTRGTGGIPTSLNPVEAGQRWVGEVPTGDKVPPEGYFRQQGTWCLAVGSGPNPKPENAIVHYYIRYVMHFEDGKLSPESNLWMIPVFASPILVGVHADQEWFSDRPIPEITGENTTDPKLLGVPEGMK